MRLASYGAVLAVFLVLLCSRGYTQVYPQCFCYEPGGGTPSQTWQTGDNFCVACMDLRPQIGENPLFYCEYMFEPYILNNIQFYPFYPENELRVKMVTYGWCRLLNWECPVPCYEDYAVVHPVSYYACTVECP